MDADVVVVGCGPTGSAFAITLARLAPAVAARTVVLEKARHPREKPCAGAVSARGVAALERLGVGVRVPHVPVRGVRVCFGGVQRVAEGDGLGVVVRRPELDATLADAARGVVGELREEAPVVRIERDGAAWVVSTERGDEVRARILVGADGSGSVVRKLLRFAEPRRKAHVYVLETPPLPGEAQDGVLTFDLDCLQQGVGGYCWAFPTILEGRPAVSRGIYHLNAHRPAPGAPAVPVKEVLRSSLARRGWDLERVRPKAFSERGYSPGAELARPGVILAGEAAGIDPVTGEGIGHALLLGELAAQAVALAVSTGDLSFATWARMVRWSPEGRHLAGAARLASHVYGPRAPRWAAFLAGERLAMRAGLSWYRGEPLGLGLKAVLAARLASHFLLGPPRGGGRRRVVAAPETAA